MASPPPSIATSLPNNGDPGGVRKDLAARGVTYIVYYTNDVLANVHGGNRRGAIDQGKLEGALTIDLDKAAGWQGLSVFANGFAIHNTGRMRRDYVGGINTIAAIEAVPTVRLSELWLEQKLPGARRASGSASWRRTPSSSSAASAPCSCRATGPRLRPKICRAAGLPTRFRRRERGSSTTQPPTSRYCSPYSTATRLGPAKAIRSCATASVSTSVSAILRSSWARRRFATIRLSRMLALPARSSSGLGPTSARSTIGASATTEPCWPIPPAPESPPGAKGNGGVYGVIEQQLYRPAGGDAESGISVYSRISASPSDRNPIDFYVDGGIIFAGLIPRRPNDKFGAGFIYSRFSDSVRAFDRDTAAFAGVPGTLRDFEANLELIYQIQIVPGWIVQPNMQFIWHPSGDADRDAMVVGARSFWQY